MASVLNLNINPVVFGNGTDEDPWIYSVLVNTVVLKRIKYSNNNIHYFHKNVSNIPSEMEYFHTITIPNVRKQHLNGLLSNLKQIILLSKTDKIIIFLQQFSLPQKCLDLLRDNRFMDTDFQVLEIIFSEFSDTEYCKQISLLMHSKPLYFI